MTIKNISQYLLITLTSFTLLSTSYASPLAQTLSKASTSKHVSASLNAPTTKTIEVGFSPDGDAEAVVLKLISSAKSSIRLAAYIFTSTSIKRALINAKERGVDIAFIVDEKANIDEGPMHAKCTLDQLAKAGINIRTTRRYAIHHDKYIIVDERHVETGSFNYTASAAKRNSENVLILWNYPDVASEYLRHWQSRYDEGTRLPLLDNRSAC